jgi:hypothetical protein
MSGKWNTIAFEILGATLGDTASLRALQARIQSATARLRNQIETIGYQAPQGNGVAWTGDDEAPYIKVINTPDNPVQINGEFIGGGVAHDTPEPTPSYPTLIGGVATALAPVAVSADLDRVRAWFDLYGRQQVNHPLMFAGENRLYNYVGVMTVPSAVEQDSYDMVYNAASASSSVAKAIAGRLYQIYVFNPTGGTLNFQLHNLAGAPGGGAVPFITPYAVPTNTALFLDWGPLGAYFDTGIVMGSSSVYATFTGSTGLHMTAYFK